jgi:hypothetical protein
MKHIPVAALFSISNLGGRTGPKADFLPNVLSARPPPPRRASNIMLDGPPIEMLGFAEVERWPFGLGRTLRRRFDVQQSSSSCLSDRPLVGQVDRLPPPLRSRTSDRRRPRRYLPLTRWLWLFRLPDNDATPTCSSRHCQAGVPGGDGLPHESCVARRGRVRRGDLFLYFCLSAAHGAPSATASTSGPISWVAGTALHIGRRAFYAQSRVK